MSALLQDRVWQQQPLSAVGINLGHPLSRGLVFSALPGVGDLVSGAGATRYGTAVLGGGRNARRYVSDDTANDAIAIELAARHPLYSITTQFTIAIWLEPQSVTSFTNYFSVPYAGGASWVSPYNSLVIYRGAASSFNTNLQWANTAAGIHAATFTERVTTGAGSYACYVFTRNGTACAVYKNGVLLQTATASGNDPVNWGSKRPVVLLNSSETSLPNGGYAGFCDGCDIWNRPLSAGEIAEYFRNRYSFLQPRRSWLPLSAGVAFKPAWACNANTVIGAGAR